VWTDKMINAGIVTSRLWWNKNSHEVCFGLTVPNLWYLLWIIYFCFLLLKYLGLREISDYINLV